MAPEPITIPARQRVSAMNALWRLQAERRRWWHRLPGVSDWRVRGYAYERWRLLPASDADLAADFTVDVIPTYRYVWLDVLRELGLDAEADRLQEAPHKYRYVDEDGTGQPDPPVGWVEAK